MTCPEHGPVRPCGGISRPSVLPQAWGCDPTKAHCPECGARLRWGSLDEKNLAHARRYGGTPIR